MSIYTKVGDKGETAVLGGKMSKSNNFIEMFGNIDEAQALVGLLNEKTDRYKFLRSVTQSLYDINGILYLDSDNDKEILEPRISDMESEIDYLMKDKDIRGFVLPQGSETIAVAHLARAVVRRAERSVVKFFETPKVKKKTHVLMYLNRLSDYLFAVALDLKGGTE